MEATSFLEGENITSVGVSFLCPNMDVVCASSEQTMRNQLLSPIGSPSNSEKRQRNFVKSYSLFCNSPELADLISVVSPSSETEITCPLKSSSESISSILLDMDIRNESFSPSSIVPSSIPSPWLDDVMIDYDKEFSRISSHSEPVMVTDSSPSGSPNRPRKLSRLPYSTSPALTRSRISQNTKQNYQIFSSNEVLSDTERVSVPPQNVSYVQHYGSPLSVVSDEVNDPKSHYRTTAVPNSAPHHLYHHKKNRPRSGKKEEDPTRYELDIQKVLYGHDTRTTLMVKNIPNKYDQISLLEVINKNFAGSYDFFYLPMDFKNKCNVGYAFINFIQYETVKKFYEEFHQKKWEKFNSEKVCQIAFARIQGKSSLIENFRNSTLMFEDQGCRPLIFHSNGPKIGTLESFPPSLV
jgi:hypothetical protein